MITTEEMYEYILKIVHSGFELIRDGRIFIIAACIILSITASLDLLRKNRKKAYLSKLTAGKKYHYALALGILLLSGWITVKVIGYAVLCSVLAVLAVIAAAAGAYFLLRWNRSGIFLADASLLLSAGALDAWQTAVVAKDIPNITSYNPGGMYSVLIAADYHCFRSELLWILVCGVIIFNSAYYMLRRFLFSGVSEEFALCPHCGKPAAFGEQYCICCGTKLAEKTEYKAPFRILDQGEYCPECGRKLRDGKCPSCGRVSLKEAAADALKGEVLPKFSGTLTAVMILVPGLTPVIFSRTWDLSKGSAVLNNNYVEFLNEFRDDREKAKDDEWYDSYQAAYRDLYQKDCEWMHIPWQSVSRNDLAYFVLYSEASFRQTEAMERIDRAILRARLNETVSEEEYSGLIGAFNTSIDEQNEAVLTARRYQLSDGVFTKFFNMMIDGLRFWTQWAPVRYIAVLMMIAGFSASLSFLGSFQEETGVRTPFSRTNVHQADVWLAGLFTDRGQKEKPGDHFEFKKSGRLVWLYGTALGCLILILSWTAAKYLPSDSSETAETEYMSLCSAVLTERFDETMVWVSRLNSQSKTFTEEEVSQMIRCFKAQIEADDACTAYEQIEEDYAEFDRRMDEFCAEEKEIIQAILASVEQDRRPAHELLVRYTGLRADTYKDVMSTYLTYLINDAGNSIIDLAG